MQLTEDVACKNNIAAFQVPAQHENNDRPFAVYVRVVQKTPCFHPLSFPPQKEVTANSELISGQDIHILNTQK